MREKRWAIVTGSLLMLSITTAMADHDPTAFDLESLAGQPGVLQTASGLTDNGEVFYTFRLFQSSSAPLLQSHPQRQGTFIHTHDNNCQILIDRLNAVLPVDEGNKQYHCTKSADAGASMTMTIIKQSDVWRVKALKWHNGWYTLHVDFADNKPLSNDHLSQIGRMREALLTQSSQANDYKLAAAVSPPAALWQWLSDNYKTFGNVALASWHSYEVISHSTHVIHAIQEGAWGDLVLDTFSTLLHILEGLEHAHYGGLGQYIHTDFHGDIIAASAYPHATNISLAGLALSLSIIELLDEHDHGQQEGGYPRIGEVIDILHTGLHIYEFREALKDWWYGHPAHDHDHHDHCKNNSINNSVQHVVR